MFTLDQLNSTKQILYFNITENLINQLSFADTFQKNAAEAFALQEKFQRVLTAEIESFSVTGEMTVKFSEDIEYTKDKPLQELTDYFTF